MSNDPIGFLEISGGVDVEIEPTDGGGVGIVFYERESLVDLIVAAAFLLQPDSAEDE